MAAFEPDVPRRPFAVEIVVPDEDTVMGASGLPLGAHRPVAEVEATGIVIVPLMMLDGAYWRTGRYPGRVRWRRSGCISAQDT